MAASTRRRTGFTLVELLVVITIIGMLMALLLPAVMSARKTARTATCLNNVKQIATAMINYETSKGQLPGYSQLIKRDPTTWAGISYDASVHKFTVNSQKSFNNAFGFSWATVILPKLERNDVYDQITNPPSSSPVEIPPLEFYICPEDEVKAQPDLAGLTYVVNSGGWDPRSSNGGLDFSSNKGDTADNGMFFDLAGYERLSKRGPITRVGQVKDGAGTTILLSENRDKTYIGSGSAPEFSWLFGTEQQLGMVWVPAYPPQPGNGPTNQEAINRNEQDVVTYASNTPRFARPSSGHGDGVNTAFCDGHTRFIADTIDYKVYVQLMTPNGRKAVRAEDNSDTSPPIIPDFRNAAPLAENDIP